MSCRFSSGVAGCAAASGLKAAFTTFEPKTLPEAVFQAEPERGWRFSQYARSRVWGFRRCPSQTSGGAEPVRETPSFTLLARCGGCSTQALPKLYHPVFVFSNWGADRNHRIRIAQPPRSAERFGSASTTASGRA